MSWILGLAAITACYLGPPCDNSGASPCEATVGPTFAITNAAPMLDYDATPLLALGGTEPIVATLGSDVVPFSELMGRGISLDDDDGVIVMHGDSADGMIYYTGGAYDAIAIAPFDHAQLVEPGASGPTPPRLAWMTGSVNVGVVLFDADGDQLIDTSLAINGQHHPIATWNQAAVPDAGAAHYAVEVETGAGDAATLDVEVVDHLASIEPQTGLAPEIVCFAAFADDGSVVAGLRWSITIDGVPAPIISNSCVAPHSHAISFTVTATAGGLTASIELSN
ncbi:MAG TPA: hypothetical protein VH143_33005 [Kofleriaceae bacterium]|nr:hypothetical protein [Kofleriaceae bacterium]